MSEWVATTVGALGKVVTGKTPSKNNPEDWGNEYHFITPSDYGNYNKYANHSIRGLSEEGYKRHKVRMIPKNSCLVTCIGSDMGKVVLNAENAFCNQQINALIPNPSIIDNDYAYYFFKDLALILKTLGSDGTAVPILNKSDFEKIELSIPPLPEQKAIASVLSSLDDKIDLLHRQNKTLEAMAETLFRQWFIEEANEDWEEVTLADVCTRITDGSHSSPASVEDGYPMASVKDMYDWGINQSTCRKISKEDYEVLVQADCKALQGDILIAKDGSYLKHVFLMEESLDVVLLSSIAMLRPNGQYHPMLLTLFLKLDSTHELMQNIVTGAVIPRIVLKDFRKFPIQLPPKDLQDKAVKIVKPIFEKCWENNRQIQTLENLRDTLLPKLMSGEVRVQYQTEEVA